MSDAHLILYCIRCEYPFCDHPDGNIIQVNNPNLVVWHPECYDKQIHLWLEKRGYRVE